MWWLGDSLLVELGGWALQSFHSAQSPQSTHHIYLRVWPLLTGDSLPSLVYSQTITAKHVSGTFDSI